VNAAPPPPPGVRAPADERDEAPVVTVHELVKRFGALTAVASVSFDIHPREIFAILGPNGSGKTTTLRMIMHIILPDRGAITVLGKQTSRAANDLVGRDRCTARLTPPSPRRSPPA
jgi:ABC-2 type transport system ATP-binding protein